MLRLSRPLIASFTLPKMAALPREFPFPPSRSFSACFSDRVAFQSPRVLSRRANDGRIRRHYRSSDVENLGNVEEISNSSVDPPLLLLEGDEFFVSHDGISRTMYRLRNVPVSYDINNGAICGAEFMVEELYHLSSARKSFILRQTPLKPVPSSYGQSPVKSSPEILGKSSRGVVGLGPILEKVQVQEIDQGVFGSAGTGSTTWESSVCMALFFALNPSLLSGDVVELGSGIGLGGILTQRAACGGAWADGMRSLTLTDNSDEVLDQCKENIVNYASAAYGSKKFEVKKLDWNDFVETNNTRKAKEGNRTYDTLIGSDICYFYPDIRALSETIVKLLKPDGRSKIHLFGPLNRGALHDLERELKVERKMDVSVECIEMERYRLKPVQPHNHGKVQKGKDEKNSGLDAALEELLYEEECPYASKNIAQVLHITASHSNVSSEEKMGDLD